MSQPEQLSEAQVVAILKGYEQRYPGTLVSLRRDKIQIIHPVTGELLGELDEEVGTAKVVEVRDRFSVAEIQAAIGRIENGTYGIDEETGEPIDPARLEAQPTARTNVHPQNPR